MQTWKCAAVAAFLACAGTGTAFADDCTGRDHTGGTVLGALGGAAIGGAASHNAGGAVAGAVVGGLAGNAIARSQDCARTEDRRTDYDRGYGPGYSGAYAGYQPSYIPPDEDDYWGVDSYDDFNNDYRHIWTEIQRGRDEGSLSRGRANHYLSELQRIRERADRQQRSGRFDPEDIEARLRDLRGTIQYARSERGGDGYDRR